MTGSVGCWMQNISGFFAHSELVRRIKKSRKEKRDRAEKLTPCWEGWFNPLGLVNG